MKAHERLAWAIEHHGPGDRTARAFQRELRKHLTSRIMGSYYTVRRYVEGAVAIPPTFFEAAAKVLRPVSAGWLETGQGSRFVEGHPTVIAEDGEDGEEVHVMRSFDSDVVVVHSPEPEDDPAGEDEGQTRTGPEARDEGAGSPPADSPYADIYPVVERGGPNMDADALEVLDPKYPRGGQTERNWMILWAVVAGGATYAMEAERVGLSEARVRAICEEYAELVRNVSGINA